MKTGSSKSSGDYRKPLYEAKKFPVFQNRMYTTAREASACTRGDIFLVQDPITGLVYNESFRPELVTYDANYQNEQALSPAFERHLTLVADIIDKEMGLAELVEVGCGKGYFLELLLGKGFDVTGFDPAYEGDNPKVQQRRFEKGSGIRAKGIILRHVLEHIQDPVSFLMNLRDENGGEGLIYIEVPCFDWICQKKAWFDVYYEHVNYFRKTDFYRMFGSIKTLGHTFGGQYLYVVAELGGLRQPVADVGDRICFPNDFLEKLKIQDNPENRAIWGGASKGVIFSLLRSRTGHDPGIIIDINPAKQGKYIAATGLRVFSPNEALDLLPPGATIFVMNSFYLEEIKTMSNYVYKYVTIDHD